MTNHNLEQQIGELTGTLRALVPALEKVEERVHLAEERAAILKTKYEALRTEFDDFRTKTGNRIAELYKSSSGNSTRSTTIQNGLAGVIREVNELRKARDGWLKKLWDLAKIILAAAAGGFIQWWLTGRK